MASRATSSEMSVQRSPGTHSNTRGARNEPPRDLLGDLAARLLVQRQIGGAGAAADGAVAVVVGDEIKRLGWGGSEGWLAAGGFAEGG
jgi:hypothetical protein